MKYSIVITTFNSASCIDRALDGIEQLAHLPDETILVDDCSTDETISLIRKRLSGVLNIRILQNSKNMGQSYSRNLGVSQASNQFVIFMDDDDFSLPQRPITHLDSFADGADFSFVSSRKIYQNGYAISAINDDLYSSAETAVSLIRHLTTNTPLAGSKRIYSPSSTLAVRKEAFLKLNGFREDMRRLEDIEIACRALSSGLTLNWSSKIMVERTDTLGSDKNAEANFIGEIAVLDSVKELLGRREYFVAKEMSIFRKVYFDRKWSAIFKKSFVIILIISLSPSKMKSVYNRLRHDIAQRF
jgi:glycosyltransferase involved in cell wall biosynthesis